MRKNILSIFVLCLVLCINFSACSFSQENYENKKAADFSLQDLTGKNISLNNFNGKGVILFFWATWCPHCQRALSQLDSEYKNIDASGIKLLAIDIGEPKTIVEKFKLKYSIGYPILLDSDGEVAHKYGVLGVPTFIFISKKGNIVSVTHALTDFNYKDVLLK